MRAKSFLKLFEEDTRFGEFNVGDIVHYDIYPSGKNIEGKITKDEQGILQIECTDPKWIEKFDKEGISKTVRLDTVDDVRKAEGKKTDFNIDPKAIGKVATAEKTHMDKIISQIRQSLPVETTDIHATADGYVFSFKYEDGKEYVINIKEK